MTETKTVVVEREMTASPEKLWRALTQPHLMEEWLMKNDFKPEVGHSFTLKGEWGGTLDCKVLEIEPNKSLSYSWDFDNPDPAYALKSVVTFTLTATSKVELELPAGPVVTQRRAGRRWLMLAVGRGVVLARPWFV